MVLFFFFFFGDPDQDTTDLFSPFFLPLTTHDIIANHSPPEAIMKVILVIVSFPLFKFWVLLRRGLLSRLGLLARAWLLPHSSFLFFFFFLLFAPFPHKLFNNGAVLLSGHGVLTTLVCQIEEQTSRR